MNEVKKFGFYDRIELPLLVERCCRSLRLGMVSWPRSPSQEVPENKNKDPTC